MTPAIFSATFAASACLPCWSRFSANSPRLTDRRERYSAIAGHSATSFSWMAAAWRQAFSASWTRPMSFSRPAKARKQTPPLPITGLGRILGGQLFVVS